MSLLNRKSKYYNYKKINNKNAVYNLIIGERSNGKTYGALKQAIEKWYENKEQFVYVRRWREDVIGRRAKSIFTPFISDGTIEDITNNEYSGVAYVMGSFYMCTYDENGKPIYSDNDVIGYPYALSENEHNKSTSYPKVKTIIFDEFITNHLYLQDEFVLFMNTVSTIVRKRTDIKIYMLGNTVNKFCPYFKEMGLTNVDKMKQGSIDVYSYGDNGLTVAVEYCDTDNKNKQNNFYFGFDNPKLEMIKGGAWEINAYPHIPIKYKPKDVVYTYFIIFSDKVYQCEIVNVDKNIFTYIHEKTTELKDTDNDLIYDMDYNSKMNYNTSIKKPMNKLQERIYWFYRFDRVYYQDNTVGDAIHNYLKLC